MKKPCATKNIKLRVESALDPKLQRIAQRIQNAAPLGSSVVPIQNGLYEIRCNCKDPACSGVLANITEEIFLNGFYRNPLFPEIDDEISSLYYDDNIKLYPIPPSLWEVYVEIPELLHEGGRYYKIKPRPSHHPAAREYGYYQHCLRQVTVDGLWAAFGVRHGTSTEYLIDLRRTYRPDIKNPFYGFDSFEGLPQAWAGEGTEKGGMSVDGVVPKIEGATFVKGWFKDTIPEFLKDYDKACAFLHIDCDIYSSTKDVFDSLGDKIVEGTVILFDELIGYPGWKEHEYKAFKEFAKKAQVEYEWLAHVPNAGQAACKIVGRGR